MTKRRVQQKERAGTKVIVEPFDIQLPKEFKECNNTRKVDYPMMLKKFNHEKIEAYDFHDFRRAMIQIVRMDNDEMFTDFLAQKSGRAQVKREEMTGMRKFVSTVQVNPEEAYDRTSPQKVGPRGYYTSNINTNSSGGFSLGMRESNHRSTPDPLGLSM